MGRKTDVLLRGFRAAKCLTVLKLATARIKVLRNKRSISAKQMRGEIAQLLKSGQDAQVYITKADALIKQENMVACYDIIDQYCHAIISRFPMIEMQSTCPIDMKGPIATLIFAAPRCVELSELASIKEAFIAKYGKEFAAAATELRPDCGVDKQVIELLSTRPASGDMKLKLMKEICVENNVNWTPGEALAEPSTSMRVGSSKQPVKTEVEAVKVTEHVGSSKATLVEAASLRVSEAGRSNLSVGTKSALQGGSKHEGKDESGIAAVEPLKPGVLAANASKSSSGTKHGLSPEKDVGKANASVLLGLKGAASTGIPSVKSGLAAAGSLSGIAAVEPLKPVVLATDASKSSGTKHGLSPEKDVGKANASVSQSLKGAASTGIPSVKSGLAAAGSLKTGHGAVFSPNAFKINDTKDEGMGSASLTALQSLKGVINTGTSSAISGSFKESKGEPVAKAEAYAQPVVDAQDGMSDSDTDSFVSVEEERFEDDAEGSSKGGAARSESFGKNSLQAPVEADVNGPSLIKKPSREARENSPSTERPHEDVYSKAISKKSSFAMESAQEDIFLKASSKNSLNTEEKPFRAESRKSSLGEEKSTVEISYEDMFLRAQNSSNTDILLEEKAFRADSRKNSLRENSPSIERPHEDVYSKASSKKSGFTMESAQEDMFLKASSKNSLDTEEKPFRAESKKSSLGEEKSTGLTMKISHEDMFLRASSKNSSNPDILLEEKAFRADSRKNSLREKQLAEEQSFKQVRENSLMKEQLEEEQHFEARVEEGVQGKDFLEDVSVGTTTESSVPQMLVEEYPSEERQNWMTTEDGLQGKGIIEDPSFVAITESSLAENLVEMKKIESFSYGISAEETSSGAGEEVAGKEAALNIKKSPESVSKQIDDVPSIGKGVQELAGSASLGALATPDDFAAAAKAIAAEAARLAVLDYAKRIAGSSAIPIDLTDLSKFGLDFEGESQVTKKLHFEGKSELFHSQEVRHGGDSTIDVIKGEASKVEIAVNDDEAINSDHAKMTLTKDESLQQPDMASGNDDINPFATGIDKATNSLFSETGEDDSSSWANQTKPELMSKSGGFGPELMSKAGGFGQEEDHLDVFFRRKTPRFDEEGYSFVKVNPSFLEERVSYLGYDKKESISQDKFFVSTPVFDSFPESQSMVVEESSGSFKSPVFDDAGPSFDDGLDKSTLSVGLSDKERPQSPSNLKASASFDLEPEPSFDKVVDEEEQSSIEKRGSTQVGQLKWQSNKASEQATSGETSASDTSLGGARNPLSRRSRKQPQRIDEYAYASEIPGQAKLFTDGGLTSKRPEGSFNTLMQQQRKEQGRKDKYDAADKGNLRTKPAESFAYSSDAMSERPSSSPKRVSNQRKSDFSKQSQPDRWDSTSSIEDHFPSIRTTKSPMRSSQLQKVPVEESDEDYYFAEEIGNSSAGSSTNRRTTKSPTRVPKQQLFPQGYDDGAEGYIFSNKPSRMPNFSQLDLVDDDSTEGEPVPRYKPFRQSDDLSKGTSASSAMYRQKPHRQQEDYRSETVHTEYVEVNGVGKSNPTGPPSARRRKQPDVEEEDLASSYKPSVQSSSSSSRKKIEEDEPHLASRYKPSAQVDDLGRVSSSPMSGRRQRYQLPQEEEQEVLMEQYQQEEFYSMPLPDWRQGERHKEQKRVTRPLYGQKQDLRMEKGNSDSSTEDYEQQQEDQRRPSMLSEQEKQRRRLPAYGQEKQHRPLPLLQEYEQEERMPRPLYGRKQDLRMEKENLDSTIEDYEKQQEQWHPSMLYEQEQDGQEKQRRPLPPYRQEKQRRPPPPLYDQQEEFHSMTLPDWRQEERRKEKERMSRPLYGQKQDSRLEKEDLDLSIEDYEQHQEQLRHSSMLSEQEHGGQEKQRRRFSPYGQENLQRPLPPLQQYEQEEEKEEFYSMPSPVWQQEQQERMSRPLYGRSRLEKANVDLSIENYGQQQEEQWRTSMSSEQEQDGQEKQRRPSPPYGRRPDLKPGKENSESWQQEKIRQEQQQPSSDHQQEQQSLAEEVVKQQQQGRENERLPSPTYLRHQEIQEEKKSPELLMEHYELQKEEQLDHSTALPEGKQEQDGQRNEKRPWPLHSKKQESKHEKESLESWQQQEVHYMQQDKPSFGRKQQSLAKEEGVKGQQEKAEIKEQFPARQSPSKDEGVKGSQERPETKAQTPTRRPPSLPAKSTSQPLESSVSDPVLLATIPPPVKKPVVQPVPAATTLESSVSAPPSTSVPEVKGPKLPAQKLPSVEDLLPNFEAFRRARKGE